MLLVWTDLETTGLEPEHESVLEVAVIVTDTALNEIASFTGVTNEAQHRPFARLHPKVQEMHLKNGLWAESLASRTSVEKLDVELWGWLDIVLTGHADVVDGKRVAPQLAGSTISFDRSFLRKHTPKFHELLHYRNLDVSTLNEVARRWWPAVWQGRPGANGKPEDAKHRALDDIRGSIDALRYYLGKIAPAAHAGVSPLALSTGLLDADEAIKEQRL